MRSLATPRTERTAEQRQRFSHSAAKAEIAQEQAAREAAARMAAEPGNDVS